MKDAPHPVLSDYYPEEETRKGFLRRMFDETSRDYDRIERVLGLGTGPWYRREALLRAGLKPGMRVLDVGIGTGLVARKAIEVIGDPSLLVGVDPSVGMMNHARLPAGVRLLEGRAESLPVESASFDFVSMGFALRHVSSLSESFAEFHRVLKPGGRLCILEITRPEKRLQYHLLRLYAHRIVPALARLLARSGETTRIWRYYWETIDACVPPEQVLQALRDAGFADARRHVELGMFSEYQATR